MVLSVPVPSSKVNCNNFFDLGTATHSFTLTALKSDLLNVSKSTSSSNKGSIFTFEVKGDEQKTKDFIDHLELFSLLANVADAKSLVIHPASTTHAQMNDEELAGAGIYRNTVRLSIGIENIDDIIADLEKGFAAIE